MKRFSFALLLSVISALAQTTVVGPAAGLSIFNPSGNNCAPGYPSLLYATSGTIYTCQTGTYQPATGGGGGGTGNAAATITLSFSATPTFASPSNTAGTVETFMASANAPIVLTGNVTSSTFSNGTTGESVFFLFKQDATGGRTVAMPTGFDACPVHLAPNVTTKCGYVWDGANGRLIYATSDAGYAQCAEGAAPTALNSGQQYLNCDNTRHTFTALNSLNQTHMMPRTAQAGDQLAYGDLIGDFPETLFIPAANCNNTSGGAGWSIGSGGSASCRAGTNDLGGYITISDTAATFATFQIAIPEDWDTGTNPFIRFQLASTDTTSGHTVIPQIQVACYKGDGTTTDDVAPNAVHSLSTVTTNTTANQFWSTANVQMNATDVTGCVAGALMQITVGRATDTATNARFYGATVTIPRKPVMQAN